MWNILIQSVDRYVRIVVNYIDDVDDFVDFDGKYLICNKLNQVVMCFSL